MKTHISNIKFNINSNNIILYGKKKIIFISILIICFIFYLIYLNKEYFTNNNSNIIVKKYTIGFFACCCDILKNITIYYNNNKNIPDSIDSSQQFEIYKPKWVNDDITYHFFEHPNKINISINRIQENIDFDFAYQYYKYSDINYNLLDPFIKKYFSPSQDIINIQKQLIEKYNINTDQYCSVYYRGTDKKEETIIGSFDIYIDKMNEILNKNNKNIKFIIQSDNKNFIDTIKEKFNNSISFDENVSSYTDKGIHNENTPDNNYIIMKNFLAIVYIMSKCKYIICSSGNCSLWIMLFRGNGNNVSQLLNNKWL